MRSGVRLWAILMFPAALLSGACSGGYPLEPTRCDDWCDATQGTWDWSCGSEYDPAGCVSQCEAQRLDIEKCRPYFDTAVECYRTTPGAAMSTCVYAYDPFGTQACQNEVVALMACSGSYGGPVTDIDSIR